jgi:hypothetical protein
LVSEYYYEEDLAYQKVIDKSAKTAQLSGDVKVNLNQIKREIKIQLPPEFNNVNAVGKWNLYFAADQKMDLEGTINTNDGSQAIHLPHGRNGNYTLKVEWESNGLSYYFEEIIFL